MLDFVNYPISIRASLRARKDLWSEDRVVLLCKRWEEGVSASKIAKEIGGRTTRCSVIGKVHRLGLSGRRAAYPAVAQRKPRQATRIVAPKPVEAAPEPPRPQVEAIEPEAIAIPVSCRVTIMELRPFMCRFMLGDARDGVYCGSPTDGGSWCPSHRALCYAGAPAPNTGGRAHTFVGFRVLDTEAA